MDVYLDGRKILGQEVTTTTIHPAVGLHEIYARALIGGSSNRIGVLWAPPGQDRLAPIDRDRLYHGDVRPAGLAGRFYSNVTATSGRGILLPEYMEITPNVGGYFKYDSPVEGIHLVIWQGFLMVREKGEYSFALGRVDGQVDVALDGEIVLSTSAQGNSRKFSATKVLQEGPAGIRIEYLTNARSPRMGILWAAEGEDMRRLGPDDLIPDAHAMFFVTP